MSISAVWTVDETVAFRQDEVSAALAKRLKRHFKPGARAANIVPVPEQSPMPDEGLPSPAPDTSTALSSEATVELLERVRSGDKQALGHLVARCLPALKRWAHGRLPLSARGALDTADLVHDVALSALKRSQAFEIRHEGGLQAYLRESVMNRIYDINRAKQRRPERVELPADIPDPHASPLDRAIGRQNVERYEAALQRLRPNERAAIVGRLEMQYAYEDLAVALGKQTPDAARVAFTRALRRLADEMRHGS
jgi:RNA polymerase sigma-70 factor (ECF subfamily)